MTNEELAIKAKTGDSEAVDQLWRAIKSLVTYMAKKYYARHQEKCDYMSVEVDDLIQVGFFAMLMAIDYFDETSGYKFTTYLHYPLLGQFNKLTHSVNETVTSDKTKFEKRKIYNTRSLNAPIDDSENATELGDLLADPDAELALERIEEADYVVALHSDLEKALQEIPERHAHFIRQHYYQDRTMRGIAQEEQLSVTAIRQQINAGLRELRHNEHLVEYRAEQYSRALKGGFKSWYYSGCSIQESIVINIDERERRSKHASQENASIDDLLNQFL